MKGFQYGINYGFSWCVYGGLLIGFDGYEDVITLVIDELIELGFWEIYL